eukprot:15434650-Alexandrium_andersonii.AAC.1
MVPHAPPDDCRHLHVYLDGGPSRGRSCMPRALWGNGRSLPLGPSPVGNTHAAGPGGGPWETGTLPARAKTMYPTTPRSA